LGIKSYYIIKTENIPCNNNNKKKKKNKKNILSREREREKRTISGKELGLWFNENGIPEVCCFFLPFRGDLPVNV
jgi:hypothetical protein